MYLNYNRREGKILSFVVVEYYRRSKDFEIR